MIEKDGEELSEAEIAEAQGGAQTPEQTPDGGLVWVSDTGSEPHIDIQERNES